MTMENKVKQIIADILKLDVLQISDDAGMDKTDGWDSMKSLSIVLEIEKIFSIRFEVDEFENLTNYNALCSAIKSHTSN
jgi:acyl carrier protein